MSDDQHYGNVIWTNHVLNRLAERRMSQELVLQAFTQPDKQINGKQPGTVEFEKKIQQSHITVIAKKNVQNQWIILSSWIEPPLPGSIDIAKKRRYLEYKKASIWKKIWLDILSAVGL